MADPGPNTVAAEAAPQKPPTIPTRQSPQKLFETNCSGCHSLELPMSQRLERATWEWVVGDMVDKYGASWITEEQQKMIIDYLVENYGPNRS